MPRSDTKSTNSFPSASPSAHSVALSLKLSPQERLMQAAEEEISVDDSTLELARKKLTTKREVLNLVVGDEHANCMASYLGKAHLVLAGMNPNSRTVDRYMASCKLLDDLKNGAFPEVQAQDRSAALSSINANMIIMESNNLTPKGTGGKPKTFEVVAS